MECPGELFCCRPGSTCTRNAFGVAYCYDPTATEVTLTPKVALPSPSQGGSDQGGSNNNVNNNTNNNSNTNIINNRVGAAVPQAAAASSLMVTLAFLSVFLVSPLTFSYKVSPEPTLHPALGFCSPEHCIRLRHWMVHGVSFSLMNFSPCLRVGIWDVVCEPRRSDCYGTIHPFIRSRSLCFVTYVFGLKVDTCTRRLPDFRPLVDDLRMGIG